ncbi:CmcJ/NvfI family oxidoreductase [Emcibacter sp.]|uniref:CmcJ/NvfI family oxidoreductase n=1 Tax=Emcibacter sp. TaxID=1979954 RepID=UPI003A91FB1C
MNYLRPGGPVNRRFVAPGAEMNTGTYEPHEVTVTNARALPSSPTLESHGFQLLNHRSAISDFSDEEEVNRLYPAETEALVARATGADMVVTFGWVRRMSHVSPGGSIQPPGADVHVDIAPNRAEPAIERVLEMAGRSVPSWSRFYISSLWRAVSPPPQDWPLAVCAGYSVADDEGENNVMIRVEELPEGDEVFAPVPGEENMPAASIFPYSAGHEWFYYPDMTRDEALLFGFYDSAQGRNWRVPHTSFRDTQVDVPHARDSIEIRSIAFWLD